MPTETTSTMDRTFAALRQFARPRRVQERCELCSAGLAQEHPHLVEISTRQIVCACEACATLFDGMAGSRYRRVARRAKFLPGFRMTDAQWDGLLIPINMAFFFRSSTEDRMVVLYPSPAGAVESLLSLDAWEEIAEENPTLRELRPDIEALLVNRVGHAHDVSRAEEYYIAPIDDCYRLVGLIRANWKGLSGGSEVWTEIARYFSELRDRADIVGGGGDA
ncbi:DUF5947 family protein [Edaphobacter aggregans]|uniref:DUF5947 family protein n=1 Tax=Edaphobacter aggregans TaxID=570835 RepID=UPI00055935C3|nr:DUF5947 family protein [Edaphobacter aggregans]